MSTYSQVYMHIVFSVQNRENLLHKSWRDRLNKYIIAIIQNHKHKVLAIGGMEDHMHILIGYNITQLIPTLVMNMKRDSSIWIKENNLVPCRFAWQEGYGVFSYSYSHIDRMVKYIQNQEEHHKDKSSLDEYKLFLSKFEVHYDDKYVQ